MNARRGPRSTGDRVRRMLVMLPWLMERGEVSVAEAAARFELSEQEVVRDLELASMCGLPPFLDEMVDVFIDEGMIFTGVPRLFTRPLRLTAPEGFALLAAARVVLVGHSERRHVFGEMDAMMTKKCALVAQGSRDKNSSEASLCIRSTRVTLS